MKNKGFTMIETIITIGIGMGLFFSVIFIPANISKYNSLIKRDLNHGLNITSVITALNSDLYTLGETSINDNQLIIDDVIYDFNEKGLYRIKEGSRIKISDKNLNFTVDENNKTLNIKETNGSLDLYFSLRGII